MYVKLGLNLIALFALAFVTWAGYQHTADAINHLWIELRNRVRGVYVSVVDVLFLFGYIVAIPFFSVMASWLLLSGTAWSRPWVYVVNYFVIALVLLFLLYRGSISPTLEDHRHKGVVTGFFTALAATFLLFFVFGTHLCELIDQLNSVHE
jgi:hypothetical protein